MVTGIDLFDSQSILVVGARVQFVRVQVRFEADTSDTAGTGGL
jgi:hypothetical protein